MAALAPCGQVASNWHQLIYLRLQERDAFEKQNDAVYQSYKTLAQHAHVLKQRNQSLLIASATVAPSSTASKADTPSGNGSSTPLASTGSNPVHMAYISSLETQLASHRDEIATLYKTQGQNAQRLLVMNENLREKEEESRRQVEELARLTREHEKLKTSANDLANVVGEKEKGIQILQDELAALSLELSQIESRNEDLKKDNASLLQRWLDKMNEEAEKMNEGTLWLEEVRKKRHEGKPNQLAQEVQEMADADKEAPNTNQPKQDL